MPHSIQLTPLGHSCALIQAVADEGTTVKILLDPGSLTAPLDPIDDLDAILVTHAHQDHVDPGQIRRLRAAGPVPVCGDAATAKLLEDAGLDGVTVISAGALDIAGLSIDVSEWKHEQIYPGVPVPLDLGYRIAGRIFAPGDAFAVPEFPVEVLLLPTGAPWMKLADTLDYMRAVAPAVVVPIHDGGLAAAHREMHRGLMRKFAPESTVVLWPEIGDKIDLDDIGRPEH